MSASMCSTRRDPSKASQITNIVWQCTLQAVVQQAKQALESPRLTGEAIIKEAGSTHGDQNVPPNQGFDMGQVCTASTVHYSSMPWRKTYASDLNAWQQLQTTARAAAASSGHCESATHVHMADAGCAPSQCAERQICGLGLADQWRLWLHNRESSSNQKH